MAAVRHTHSVVELPDRHRGGGVSRLELTQAALIAVGCLRPRIDARRSQASLQHKAATIERIRPGPGDMDDVGVPRSGH
jgi:hypothetical protein